jgi:hypothetical protein
MAKLKEIQLKSPIGDSLGLDIYLKMLIIWEGFYETYTQNISDLFSKGATLET